MTVNDTTLDLVRTLIAAQLNGSTERAAIRAEHKLYELGLDSLATVSVMVSLATEFDADLEAVIDDLDAPATVADLCVLADVLRAAQPQSVTEA